MSHAVRTPKRQNRQCVRPSTMFSTGRSPTYGSLNLTSGSTESDAEGVIRLPPIITASRCNNVSAAGITRFEKKKVVYNWTVLGLKNWPEGTNGIASTSFSHPDSSEWCMVLSKKGSELRLCFWLKVSKEPVKANLRATLCLCGGEKREVYPSLCCTLRAGEKSTPKSVEDTFPFTDGDGNSDDSLTFECEVETVCIEWDKFPTVSTPERQPGLARDFGNLLDSQDFADFVLHAGDVQLKAHKAVLSARSPVFAKMLQQNMKEARENYVRIEGVEPDVVVEALRYMYTGRAPVLHGMAQGLLVFADRYDLRELKSQCEVELAKCLTVDNAATYAVFAVVNSCNALQKAAVAFVSRHIEEVLGTTGWKQALHSDPASVEKISQLIAARALSKSGDDSAKKNITGKNSDGEHFHDFFKSVV